MSQSRNWPGKSAPPPHRLRAFMAPLAGSPNCHPWAVQLYVDVGCDVSFWLLPPSINNPTPSVARQGGDRLGLGADFESILSLSVGFSIEIFYPTRLLGKNIADVVLSWLDSVWVRSCLDNGGRGWNSVECACRLFYVSIQYLSNGGTRTFVKMNLLSSYRCQ